MEFGRRELKKAKTRLDILNAVYALTAQTSFRDLKVKAIAETADVTEMTFFNYFPKKEEILGYMMGVWTLDLAVQQHQTPLTGEAAIRRFFAQTARQVNAHPGLMVGFISYLVTNEIAPVANPIEAADRALLYPDLPEAVELPLPSGNELLTRHLLEMDPSADPTVRMLHLASCFYGDVLVAHTAGLDLDALYAGSLDLIFRSS